MQRGILRIVHIQLTQRRFCNNQHVRVRFAPSPTGFLHLGGLRTALYNYLFARAHKGTFILRIEDTDQTRVVPGAVEKLRDDLIWSGIIPDEDPIRGGPVGPYVQSKRLDLYKEHVKKLLENGSAYYCFCSERRLELIRKESAASGQTPKYDNRCRSLTQLQIDKKLQQGMKPCVRFKLSPTHEPFHDIVYGKISYDISQMEGDPVIMKSDEYPTYHLANVVDDHLMQISHVFRGVEWQISTQKHLLLYKAFGWNPPQYGHLPLILNEDSTKLSKRQNDIRVDYFRNDGIFPLALLNYITHAGGGFVRDQTENCCYSYEQLINQFDITKVNTNSSQLRPLKLLEFNQTEICNLLENEVNQKLFVERIQNLVKKKFPERINDGSLNLDDDYVLSVLMWSKKRISKLSDLVSKDFAFLWVIPSIEQVENEINHRETINNLLNDLSKLEMSDFDKQSLKMYLRDFAKKNGVPFAELMKSLRCLLSGVTEGPGVGEMMEILGRDATLNRLKRCCNRN